MSNKKKKGFVRRTLKSAFNIPKWMDWKDITAGGKIVSSTFKTMITNQVEGEIRNESFEEAKQRLSLDEQKLLEQQKFRLRTAMIYFIISVGLLGYTLLALFMKQFRTALLTLSITTLTAVLAYREHFWYIQIKHRRLGCTFKDWLELTFKTKQQRPQS